MIVETTFKVYAYTTSAFQLSLLNLFLRFDYHLPNLLVASITKARVSGTRSDPSTSLHRRSSHYLEQYAHPLYEERRPGAAAASYLRMWWML